MSGWGLAYKTSSHVKIWQLSIEIPTPEEERIELGVTLCAHCSPRPIKA